MKIFQNIYVETIQLCWIILLPCSACLLKSQVTYSSAFIMDLSMIFKAFLIKMVVHFQFLRRVHAFLTQLDSSIAPCWNRECNQQAKYQLVMQTTCWDVFLAVTWYSTGNGFPAIRQVWIKFQRENWATDPQLYFLSILQVKHQNRGSPCRFIASQGIMPLLHIN